MKRLSIVVSLVALLATSAYAMPMLPDQAKLYETDFSAANGWNTAADQFIFWGSSTMNTATQISGGTLHSGGADKAAARLDLSAALGSNLDLAQGAIAVYAVVDSQGLSHNASDPTVVLHKAGSGDPGNLAGFSLRPAGAAEAPGCQDSMGEKHDHGNVGDGTNTVVIDSPGIWHHDDPQTFAVLFTPVTSRGADEMSVQLYHLVGDTYELVMDNTDILDPMDTVFGSTTAFDSLDVCFRGSGSKPSIGLVHELAVSQVPEPATIALLGLGGLALLRRRRAK
jgi:hypothetical protein